MPIWMELTVLALIAYGAGVGLGWIVFSPRDQLSPETAGDPKND